MNLFKKIAASALALAMLGSIAVMPVSADTSSTGTSNYTASYAAQIRGNGGWTTKNSSSNEYIAEPSTSKTIEVSDNAYMGAFYSFDAISQISGATVESVSLVLNTGNTDLKVVKTDIPDLENKTDSEKLTEIFSKVSAAIADDTKAVGNMTSSNTIVLKDGSTDKFNFGAQNTYFVYWGTVETNKRTVKPQSAAKLVIKYSGNVAQVVSTDTGYTTLTDAITNVGADGTVKLLLDADVSNARLNLQTNDFTITSDTGRTITVASGNNNNGGMLVKKNINLNNVNVKVSNETDNAVGIEDSKTLAVNNGTVTGRVHIKAGTLKLTGGSNVTGQIAANKTGANIVADGDAIIESLAIYDSYNQGAATVTTTGIEDKIAVQAADGATLKPSQVKSFANTNYALATDENGNLKVVAPKVTLTKSGESTAYAVYSNFEDACRAAASGDTITLLDDVTVSDNIYLVNGTGDDFYGVKSNITIVGTKEGEGNYSINLASGKKIEFANGSGTITLTNVDVTGGNGLDVKGNTVINATGSAISKLSLGGSAESKGTLTNSTVTAISTYGKLSLANSQIGSVEFPGINSSGNDTPKITGDAESTVTTVTFGAIDTAKVVFPYPLFDGAMTKPAVSLTGTSFETGYEYANGIISVKTASAAATAEIKTFTAGASSTSVGLAVTVGETAVNNITVKIGDKTVMSYPATGTIEANKTVNFGILVRRSILQSDINVVVDGSNVSVTQKN